MKNDTTKIVEEKCPFCGATHSTTGYQFGHKWICGTIRQRTTTINRSTGCRNSEASQLKDEIERLQAIVDKLPKTKDGVPYAADRELYNKHGEGVILSWAVVHLAGCYYSTREAAQAAKETVMTRPRPGPGWTYMESAVYDHVSGIRIHISGVVQLLDGTILDGTQWPETKSLDHCIRVCGGSRRRGVMVWALKAAEAAKEE